MASNLILQLSGYLTAGVVRDGVFPGTVESDVLGEEVERGEGVDTPLPGEPEMKWFIFWNVKYNCRWILIVCYVHRRVWRYQRYNQNPYIEEEQTTQWPNEKVQMDKQRSTKHSIFFINDYLKYQVTAHVWSLYNKIWAIVCFSSVVCDECQGKRFWSYQLSPLPFPYFHLY